MIAIHYVFVMEERLPGLTAEKNQTKIEYQGKVSQLSAFLYLRIRAYDACEFASSESSWLNISAASIFAGIAIRNAEREAISFQLRRDLIGVFPFRIVRLLDGHAEVGKREQA